MAGTDRKRATRGRLAAALSAAVKTDQDGGTQRTRSVPICPLSVMKSIKDSVDGSVDTAPLRAPWRKKPCASFAAAPCAWGGLVCWLHAGKVD